MRPLLTLALLVGVAAAAPVPKELKKKGDVDLIVGTWKPAQGRTEWFEFTVDGGMKAWNTGGSAATGVPYTWSLDPTATPKRMTWCSAGQTKPSFECVYDLDGDTLRISYVSAGNKLPTEVAATGGHVFFCDLRRDTSSK